MTVANVVSIVRILMIPAFMLAALSGVPSGDIWALAIFLIASVTDWVDGYIARKYNQVTTFGKFLDPLADKLLVAAAILVLVSRGIMGSAPAMLIIAREFVVTSLRIVAMGEGIVIAAQKSGKIKTFMQIVGIALLFTPLAGISVGILGASIGDITVWLITAVTVVSGIEYFRGFGSVLNVSKTTKGEGDK